MLRRTSCRKARALAALLILAVATSAARGGERSFEELHRFKIAEAHQGVAVDAKHFYAITNSVIGKYVKQSGRLLTRWQASDDRPLVHLNGGVVLNGKLYCAHSDYPHVPPTSSVEIWDADSLNHVDSHSFGIADEGSLTWIDRHDDAWWAVFAQYSRQELSTGQGKDSRWTTLVKFDDRWRRLQAWVFPAAVVERIRPYSISGGAWGPDDRLYCSGHDRPELYVLELPQSGSTLRLLETLPVSSTGQGFAWDRSDPGAIYTISRKTHEVIVSRLHPADD